jgi:hypothetical protein
MVFSPEVLKCPARPGRCKLATARCQRTAAIETTLVDSAAGSKRYTQSATGGTRTLGGSRIPWKSRGLRPAVRHLVRSRPDQKVAEKHPAKAEEYREYPAQRGEAARDRAQRDQQTHREWQGVPAWQRLEF